MSYPYQPDYAVHPGEVIKDVLDELNLSQRALCDLTGYSEKHVSQLLKGKVSLTPDAAVIIAGALRISARMLMRLQADFDVWRIESAS